MKGKRINPPGRDSRFRLLLSNNSSVIFSFMCAIAVVLLFFFCYAVYPFGDKNVFRMDLYHQYGPLFAELYERLTQSRSLLYSWNSGGGSGFLGNYLNYLASPAALLTLLFGHVGVPNSIGAMVLLKAGLSSAAFTYYLRRSQGKNNFSAAAFGVLYAFCGFFIAYFWNVMWLDAMVLFPLVVLGIEKAVHRKRFTLFALSLAATLVTNYYMGYMVCIFSVVYFFIFYFSSFKLTALCDAMPDKQAVFDGSKTVLANKLKLLLLKIKYSRFLRAGLNFASGALVAGALAAAALVPVFFVLRNCSATSGTFPSKLESYFSVFDFLANHLASLDPTIRSSGEDVLPNVYCGIVTIILIPLYLFCGRIKLRERLAHVALLAFFFFSFNTNFANYIWHGFHFPNDLPYRFSFIYSFILLAMAFKCLVNIRAFTAKQVMGAGLGVLAFIIAAEKIGSKNILDYTIIISIIFCAIYTVVLAMFTNKKYRTSSISLLLLCCIVAEAAIADTDHFNLGQTNTAFTSDYDEFAELKGKLDSHDKGFYRMELTNLRARMDPCWFDYNGLSTFSSMAYEKTANLQSRLGMFSNYINSYTYHLQTPVYNAMMSLKYVVNNSDSLQINPDYYTFMTSVDKFSAYSNKYFLPIAYCVSPDILDWERTSQNPFIVQSDYFRLSTGLEGVFDKLEITNVEYNNIEKFTEGFDDGEFVLDKIDNDSGGSVHISVSPAVSQSCYLYVRSSGVDSIFIDGETIYASQDIGEPYVFDMGKCEAGESLTIEIPLAEDKNYSTMYFFAYGLNQPVFQTGYDLLSSGRLRVDSFEDTRISGSITAAHDCIMYTSIPYDDGWSVAVDGKPVASGDYHRVGDALLGVALTKGEHTVELEYFPRGLAEGLIISALGVVVLLLYIVLAFLKGKRRRRKELERILENGPDDGEDYESRFYGIKPLGSDSVYAPEDLSIEDCYLPPSAREADGERTSSAPLSDGTQPDSPPPGEAKTPAQAESEDGEQEQEKAPADDAEADSSKDERLKRMIDDIYGES